MGLVPTDGQKKVGLTETALTFDDFPITNLVNSMTGRLVQIESNTARAICVPDLDSVSHSRRQPATDHNLLAITSIPPGPDSTGCMVYTTPGRRRCAFTIVETCEHHGAIYKFVGSSRYNNYARSIPGF